MAYAFLVEEELVAILKTFDQVAAIVGAGDVARIRPGELGQVDDLKDGPAIVIRPVEEQHTLELAAIGGGVQAEIDIETHARNSRDARILGKAIAFNQATEDDEPSGLAGFRNARITAELVTETVDPKFTGNAGDGKQFRVTSRYRVWYTEPAREE